MEEFNVSHWAYDWFQSLGMSATGASYMALTLDLILLLIISLVADYIARRVILNLVSRYAKRSKTQYDDILLEKKVFQSLAHLVPAAIIWYSLPLIFGDFDFSIGWLREVITVYMIVLIIVVITRLLRAVEYVGLRSPRLEGKPISSYVQVGIIVAYIIGAVLILSMIVGKDPLTILAGFGAATAVILLIFKDTILGLVASIQISANDMVRLGDWVSMEKYGADGDVIEINLTTVKVRNWDKTISTVPTYAFISDSFKNWRGMQALGVRRIKRSISIDMSSVQFVTPELREQFMKYRRVAPYIRERQEEIDRYNRENNIDTSELINGRHMTNIGVFRKYIENYLRDHPKIAQDQTIMVRQLQPTETGLPLEIYCFSSDIAWVNYEGIQADIFDHLLSAAPRFGVRIFQNPTGSDFRFFAHSAETASGPSNL